jgi:hypothetical protein
MGLKMFCVFINEREPGYLGTFPAHDPEKAKEMLKKLGYSEYSALKSFSQTTTLSDGIDWLKESIFIGAYPGATVICDEDLALDFFRQPHNERVKHILATFPNATIVVAFSISTCSGWGYAVYEEGKLVRMSSGDGDTGITHDFGSLLPEELPHFKSSVVRDGMRYFLWDSFTQQYESNHVDYGESLMFSILNRIFGHDPIEQDGAFDKLEAERFRLRQQFLNQVTQNPVVIKHEILPVWNGISDYIKSLLKSWTRK